MYAGDGTARRLAPPAPGSWLAARAAAVLARCSAVAVLLHRDRRERGAVAFPTRDATVRRDAVTVVLPVVQYNGSQMRSEPTEPLRSQPTERIGTFGRRARAGSHLRRMLGFQVAMVAIALLVSGCGGGSPSTTASSSTVASSASSRFLAFARCMRAHGATSYPNPKVTASGNHVSIQISPGAADPNSPAFNTANHACHHLLPNRGLPASVSSGQLAQDVTFADCMRAHGVPSFPDPDRDGVFTLPAGIDPQAPQVQRAQHDCVSVEPSSLSIDQSPPR